MKLVATRVTSLAFVFAACEALACAPPNLAADPLKATTTGEAYGGAQCSAVRPPTEPDLMAWDPASRANLNSLRRQGVVVVKYTAVGCNVELQILSNCVARGTYEFAAYSANDTKVAHNAAELYAQLPVGAARFAAKMKGDRALRTDYMLAGVESVQVGTSFRAEDLVGECAEATHVVSRIYVGGFAMVAGESRALDAQASVFLASAGGSTDASVEHVQDEGERDACANAQREGTESPQCAVPLRVGLLAIVTSKPAAPTTAATEVPTTMTDDRASPKERETAIARADAMRAEALAQYSSMTVNPMRTVNRGLGITSLAIGSVCLVVSGFLDAAVLSNKSTMDQNCRGNSCNQAGIDAANSGQGLSLATTIVTAVGVGTAGLGIYAIARNWGDGRSTKIGLSPAPGGGAFALTQAF